MSLAKPTDKPAERQTGRQAGKHGIAVHAPPQNIQLLMSGVSNNFDNPKDLIIFQLLERVLVHLKKDRKR